MNIFGGSRIGRRNARGHWLMQWVFENGLLVKNTLDHKFLSSFQFWQPTLSDNGLPGAFQENVLSLIRS